jgi:hypothetical protein
MTENEAYEEFENLENRRKNLLRRVKKEFKGWHSNFYSKGSPRYVFHTNEECHLGNNIEYQYFFVGRGEPDRDKCGRCKELD